MRRTVAALATLALAGALALMAGAPAHAAPPAPKRADGSANPVIFIHGFSKSAKTDCKSTWKNATSTFKDAKWKGSLVTYGYYKKNTNCTLSYKGDTGTSIKTIGKDLAWQIYNRYTKYGSKVDVVAHSMGGLVIRSALTEVQKKTKGYPSFLYVEDVVTLGTPHKGAKNAWLKLCPFKQCKEMKADSTFLKGLKDRPTSKITTDWTAVSSLADNDVSATSGVGMNAQHKVQYKNLSHTQLRSLKGGTSAERTMRNWNSTAKKWNSWITGGDSPLARARKACYYHKTV